MKKIISFLIITLLLTTLSFSQTVHRGKRSVSGGGGGGGDFVTDSITEASDLTFASHTPELGGTITKHLGAAYVSTATINSTTDFLFPLGTTAYFYSATPPSASYYVQFTVKMLSDNATSSGPCGHMNSSTDTMICVRCNLSNGAWELREIISATGSTLGSSTTSFISTGQTKVVKLTFASGGTTAAVAIDGTTVISATAITTTTTGSAGMRFSGVSTSTTGLHWDNFSAR